MSAPQKLNAVFHAAKWEIDQSEDVRGLELSSGSSRLEFSGPDVEGVGTGQYIMTYHPNRAAHPDKFYYDGQILFQGKIAGKTGDVIFRERGHVHNGRVHADWEILTETASGELQGIVGTGSYDVDRQTFGDVKAELVVEF